MRNLEPPRDTPGPAPVELSLIGGFEVRCRTVPHRMPRCCERIVAYLALAGGPVERGRVAGTLWMDKAQDRAAANLRSTLWRLRKTGIDVLVEAGQRLWLDPRVRVDLDERDRWSSRLRRGEIVGADLEVEPARLGEELLPDWYDDWVLMERERFRQRTLHANEELIDALVRCRRFADAIDLGYRAIALEPLRESTHRAVIRAHLAEGNRGEALRHIDRCAALFRDELGIDVAPSMSELLVEVDAVA